MNPEHDDRRSEPALPGWAYASPALFAEECEHLLARAWQVVCHESDVVSAGDYATLPFLGARIAVVRGEDGRLRAFHDGCPHRGSRLLPNDLGHCDGRRIRCPYHAWSFDLRGRLVSRPGHPTVARNAPGLVPVDLETWQGFVFVRLAPGGPGVAERMAPYDEMLRPYRLPALRRLGRVTCRRRDVDWKLLVENYLDAGHVPVAHRTLGPLVRDGYALRPGDGVHHLRATLSQDVRAGFSADVYRSLLRSLPDVDAERRRTWDYLLLEPNVALDLYPDQMDFMQMLPTGPGQTVIREIPYGVPGTSRSLRAARYLNWRINRVVNAEDTRLLERLRDGLRSPAAAPLPIDASEPCLRAFVAGLRRALPSLRGDTAPD